jgi:UDP-glucose 4-epimerase
MGSRIVDAPPLSPGDFVPPPAWSAGLNISTMSRDRVVLVTGAEGFIGGAVAHLLTAQPGLSVRGGAGRLDVLDRVALSQAMAGVEFVVHCTEPVARLVTVQGTRNVLRTARAAQARRVVLVSTAAVYGTAEGVLDEETPLVSPDGRGYPHWRSAAEAACREAAQEGLEVAVLRPSIIYGPRCEPWIRLPARRLLSGRWPALGQAGRGTCNPVHVRDLAAACLAAIRAPDIDGCEAFNLSGPDSTTWHDWYARLAAALPCRPMAAPSPGAWRRRALAALPLRIAARLLPPLGKPLEPALLAAPARGELALFARSVSYPVARAAARLNWQPRIALAEGLRESLAWLREDLRLPALER